jgi:hypothetical protein
MRFLMVRGLRALAHERPAGAIARPPGRRFADYTLGVAVLRLIEPHRQSSSSSWACCRRKASRSPPRIAAVISCSVMLSGSCWAS